MPGPVHRDSVARCDDGSSIYSMIRHHHAPQNIPRNNQDKYIHVNDAGKESVQARLNRQMLERISNMGLVLPHESFVAAAQVGKYVLMAAMLPPYLLVYGIPKWIITSAIPEIYLFAKTQMIQVGNFFQKLSKKVGDLMKGALDQTLGEALRMMKRHGQRFFNYATEIAKWTGNLLTRGISIAATPFIAVAKTVGNVAEAIKEQAEKLVAKAGKMTTGIRKIAKKMSPSHLLDKAWEKTSTLATNAYHSAIANVTAFGLWMATHIQNRYNALATSFSRFIAKAIEKGSAFARIMQEAMNLNAFSKFKERYDGAVHKVLAMTSNLRNQLVNWYTKSTKMALEALKQVSQRVAKNLMRFPQTALRAMLWSYRQLPEKRRNQFSRGYKNAKRFAMYLGEAFVRGSKKIKKTGSLLTKWILRITEEARKWLQKAKNLARDAKEFIRALPMRTYEFLKRLYPHAKRAFLQFIFAFQLFFALIWALSVFGFMSFTNMWKRYSLTFNRR